jgi:hypothetical protein
MFNATTASGSLPTGVYFVRLTAQTISGDQQSAASGVYTEVKKMMLMK